jgi:hypothetical protein
MCQLTAMKEHVEIDIMSQGNVLKGCLHVLDFAGDRWFLDFAGDRWFLDLAGDRCFKSRIGR